MVKDILQLRRVSGFTLIELIVSLFLALILVGVLFQVFLSSNIANKNINYLSEVQETGRFAVSIIGKDLHSSGYFGGNIDIGNITGSTGVNAVNTTTCPTTVTTWGRMVTQYIHGLNDTNSGYDCIVDDEYLRGDILTIRYTSPWLISTYDANEMYLRNTLFEGRLFQGKDATSPANTNISQLNQSVHQLVARSYFIGESADTCQGVAIPALFWKTLKDGKPSSEELLSGVEHLQIEYGIDSNADGTPNQYKNASQVSNWNNVKVVRVSILVRSECPDFANSDDKDYTFGDIVYQPRDDFYRQLFTTSITFRNSLDN
ncbi:MAG: hypothetical protein GY787_03135 [Alteromonadales bacterium]|nr:hypothetical protein [Alteromonadales bacterium]